MFCGVGASTPRPTPDPTPHPSLGRIRPIAIPAQTELERLRTENRLLADALNKPTTNTPANSRFDRFYPGRCGMYTPHNKPGLTLQLRCGFYAMVAFSALAVIILGLLVVLGVLGVIGSEELAPALGVGSVMGLFGCVFGWSFWLSEITPINECTCQPTDTRC